MVGWWPTVDVVGVLAQNVFVELLGLVELAHGLVEPGQVVGGGDRDGVVVVLVVLALSFGPFQGGQEIFLKGNRTTSSSLSSL